MRKSVLIVSNSTILRGMLERELLSEFDLDFSKNAAEAVALLQGSKKICSVLMDCHKGKEKKETDFLDKLGRLCPGIARLAVVETSGIRPLITKNIEYPVIAKPWTRGEILATIISQLDNVDGKKQTRENVSKNSAFQKDRLFWTGNPLTWGTKEMGKMVDQEKWMGNLLDMTRMSMNAGLQSMETMQTQTEKAIDLTMGNVGVVQQETTKAINNWLDQAKEARNVYINTVQEGLSTLENQVRPTKSAKSK